MALTVTAFIGTDIWNAELYGSLSISSRLKAAISNQAAQLTIAAFFWKTNRSLESFFGKIETAIRDAESGKSKNEPVNRARIEKAINDLINLFELLDNIHQHCVRYRLTNMSRLATGLGNLRRNADKVEELAIWLQDSLNPDFKDAFATARTEFENGETVPASEVCR